MRTPVPISLRGEPTNGHCDRHRLPSSFPTPHGGGARDAGAAARVYPLSDPSAHPADGGTCRSGHGGRGLWSDPPAVAPRPARLALLARGVLLLRLAVAAREC